MSVPTRKKMREIVCDALSGLANPVPPTIASEAIVIGATLIAARTQYPAAIDAYYTYLIQRIRESGGMPSFGPDRLAFPNPAMTIGDLIDIALTHTT